MSQPDHANPPASDPGANPAPDLQDSLRQVSQAGRDTVDAAKDTVRAMRKLVLADLALARAALGRALVWVCVAIVFGASGWLLCAGALIALLVGALGWSWLAAMSATAAASLAVTIFAAMRVWHYFDHAGMKATRRQLIHLGLMDDDDDAPSAKGKE